MNWNMMKGLKKNNMIHLNKQGEEDQRMIIKVEILNVNIVIKLICRTLHFIHI